jgi:hypothetical protein
LRRFALAAALLTCGPAYAWDAMVNGPDVFGDTTVIAGEQGLQSGIVIQCSTKGDLFLALISPKKQFEEIPEVDATLYIAVPPSPPAKIPARTKSWNDNYAGVVSTGGTADLMPVLTAIRDAKSKIQIGAEVAGNRVSDSYSSSGSTSAMTKAINGCKLNSKG